VEEGVNRMRCSDFESDVTDAVGLGEPCMVRGSVFVPDDPLPGAVVVLVAIPGGTYTRAYWNLVVPNREAHSFAEHFAERGAIVIALATHVAQHAIPSMGSFASTSSSGRKTPATNRPGAPKLAGRSFTPPPPELAHPPKTLHRPSVDPIDAMPRWFGSNI
jgi:hypothetical protein